MKCFQATIFLSLSFSFANISPAEERKPISISELSRVSLIKEGLNNTLTSLQNTEKV